MRAREEGESETIEHQILFSVQRLQEVHPLQKGRDEDGRLISGIRTRGRERARTRRHAEYIHIITQNVHNCEIAVTDVRHTVRSLRHARERGLNCTALLTTKRQRRIREQQKKKNERERRRRLEGTKRKRVSSREVATDGRGGRQRPPPMRRGSPE